MIAGKRRVRVGRGTPRWSSRSSSIIAPTNWAPSRSSSARNPQPLLPAAIRQAPVAERDHDRKDLYARVRERVRCPLPLN